MPGHYRNKALLLGHYRDNILALGHLLRTQETVAPGCYGDEALPQVPEVPSVAGAACPTSAAFKRVNRLHRDGAPRWEGRSWPVSASVTTPALWRENLHLQKFPPLTNLFIGALSRMGPLNPPLPQSGCGRTQFLRRWYPKEAAPRSKLRREQQVGTPHLPTA